MKGEIMPRASYPNQRVITINREPCTRGFLQIQNENWQDACRRLRPQAFALYLYLAANANNFKLELSQADVTHSIGMPRSTYYDQFKVLENNGYLVFNGKNGYDFYEIPQEKVKACTESGQSNADDKPYFEHALPQNGQSFPELAHKNPSENGEIYNINSGTDSLIDSQDESENWWEIKETPKINYTDFVF